VTKCNGQLSTAALALVFPKKQRDAYCDPENEGRCDEQHSPPLQRKICGLGLRKRRIRALPVTAAASRENGAFHRFR
jgi:hypothetical protein